jgi:hypothetical protein
MIMTYPFDAKYRIDGKDRNGVDVPPEDAINQTHRYRDTIYYKDHPIGYIEKRSYRRIYSFPRQW